MALGLFAAWIVGAAVFPRLSHWARWPTRLGWRGAVAYTVFNAPLLFAVREFVRYGRRREGEWEQTADELRCELGREPSEREVAERVAGAG
jgi:hypothetical protein